MKSVGIRDFSTAVLEQAAAENKPVAVTSNHVLRGVLIPVPQRWLSDVVDWNLSRILHSIQAGEKEVTSGQPLTLLEEALEEVTDTASSHPPIRRVSVRNVSGTAIEEAAERKEWLAITSDNRLRGVLIPVSPRSLNEVVDTNLSRILRTIEVGEKEVMSGQPLTSLEEALDPKASPQPLEPA